MDVDQVMADRLGDITSAAAAACLWLAIRDTSMVPSVRDVAQRNMLAAVVRMNEALRAINEGLS